MNSIDDFPLILQMNHDKTEIEEFVLETPKGTKRMKESFYEKASNERNHLVEEKIAFYEETSKMITEEMKKRLSILMPSDCSDSYLKMEEDVSNYLSLVILDSNSSPSFKLGLDVIVASINDMTSLEALNEKIRLFIEKLQEYEIPLTLNDFNYTMFTEMYMKTYLENPNYESLKASFEKIYFMCPDIKLQLKMNLEYIIQKYDKELSNAVMVLKERYMREYGISKEDSLVQIYIDSRLQLGRQRANDEYYNTMEFLEGNRKIQDYVEDAPSRIKTYNQFAMNGDYTSYPENEKKAYNEAMMGLYLTLNELKKFYHYEGILTELIEYYKEKDQAKTSFFNKKKEIEKEEKKRADLYKQYCKSLSGGLFKKVNYDKQKSLMLQMNEQIKKLRGLYSEAKDLEIKYQVSFLKNTSSLFDIFLISITSFPFLEKMFSKEEYNELSLEENIQEFIKFLYNPNNMFMRNVNGFVEHDIVEIVAQKYRLLNLNVSVDMISKEAIDATLKDVSFINFIENVESSKISISTISHICEIHQILESLED